ATELPDGDQPRDPAAALVHVRAFVAVTRAAFVSFERRRQRLVGDEEEVGAVGGGAGEDRALFRVAAFGVDAGRAGGRDERCRSAGQSPGVDVGARVFVLRDQRFRGAEDGRRAGGGDPGERGRQGAVAAAGLAGRSSFGDQLGFAAQADVDVLGSVFVA